MKPGDGDHVQISVASEITRLRGVGAWQIGKSLIDELLAAQVLEPLDSVRRFGVLIVERIAVRKKDIDVSVPVQIDQLDAG
jgi:hypothetical protein